MNPIFDFGHPRFVADLSRGYDLSIAVHSGPDQVNCFYAPLFADEPVRMGTFVGSVYEGGPVNFYNMRYNVHGNGTHTEGVGHISVERNSVNKILKRFWFPVTVCSVYPTLRENGDRVIEELTLSQLINGECSESLALRTLPNPDSKKSRKYSGQNPVYISEEAMKYIVSLGVQHLLVDLPSVDREEDGGKLLAHRAFWSGERKNDCTITELIYIDNQIADGNYLLFLQLAPMELDAVPSRPVLYPLIERKVPG